MLEYHEKPWPHFTGSLPDDFYNHVKTMWDEDDAKKKWNKCKNRSNIIIEDDKIKTSLKELGLHCEDMHVLGVYKADKIRKK